MEDGSSRSVAVVSTSSGCLQFEEASNQSTQKRSQLQGGYECIFVEEPPKHLQTECSVCLSILKEPHLIDCDCGSSFCRTCIQPIKSEGKPCPLCSGQFTTAIPDRRLHRTLNSLQVYCSCKASGCEWVGELGKLTQHLALNFPDNTSASVQGDVVCQFVPVECSHCQEKFERRFIEEHKTKLCPKRPFCCEICNDYESTFEDVANNHKPICPSYLVPCSNWCGTSTKFKDLPKHLAEECPLEVINCSFSYAGCEVKLQRKDVQAHINDNLAVHMSLQAINHQKQLEKLEARIQQLEMENSELKDEVKKLKTHMQIAPVQFVMDEYASRKRSGEIWISQPFYTHLHGYRMNLSVYTNGYDEGKGTHVSIFTSIMHGNFDHHLNWPFQGSLAVTLLDQEGEEHCTKEIFYDEDTPIECMCCVDSDTESYEWGLFTFIAHNDLHPKYYKNNSLHFKVSNVTINSI